PSLCRSMATESSSSAFHAVFETARRSESAGGISFSDDVRGDAVELLLFRLDIWTRSAEGRREDRSNVVASGRGRHFVREIQAECVLRNLGHGDRRRRQVYERELAVEHRLDISPETLHIIELELASRVDLLGFVIVQKIVDDVFLEAWTVETWEPHDR